MRFGDERRQINIRQGGRSTAVLIGADRSIVPAGFGALADKPHHFTLAMICSAILQNTFTNIAVSWPSTVMPCDSSFSGWM